MPFNLLIKWWLSIYYRIKKPRQSWWEKRDVEMYSKVLERIGKELEQKYIEKQNRLDQLHDLIMSVGLNSPISKDQYKDMVELIN